jgi:hypothetical protein
MSEESSNSPVWNPAIESLIKSIGEKSLSLSWLHSRSEKRYSYLNNYLAIPSIILSTLAGVGTTAFGSDKNINLVMGGVSILVSVLTTLNSYFMFAKRAELHRITSIQYSKLYLMISIELSLPRDKRMSVKAYMKIVSESIQRLNEIQPQVPDSVIKQYNQKFKDEPDSISKPEITNGLVEILVFNEPIPPAPPPSPAIEVRELPPPPPLVLEPKPRAPFR